MKLENQVCSKEPAEKLRDLRVKQDSLWYWIINKMKGVDDKIIPIQDKREEYEYKDFSQKYISAFTVAELMNLYFLYFGKIMLMLMEIKPEDIADYIANCIIHGIENKLIEVPK